MEALKTVRASAKRALTKEINVVRRCIAENDIGDIPDRSDKLKTLFKDFTLAHNNCHDSLEADEEIEVSEGYYEAEQNKYIAVLEKVKLINTSGNADGISRNELLTLLNMPKVELQVFRGDPLHYHQFIKAFEQNVDKMCTDSDLKLSRLMQYTAGPVKEAIRFCQLISGDDGYREAKSILDNRFGNAHLVTERVIKQLRYGKTLKSSQEVQQFADEMKTAQRVLSQLNMIREVDSQAAILDIVGRLQGSIQTRWKKHALKTKKSSGSYPGFKDLVTFVADIAAELNDPVYGNFNSEKPEKSKERPGTFAANFSMSASESGSNGYKISEQGAVGGMVGGESVKKSQSYARSEPPCVLCKEHHRLWHCNVFRKMTPQQRLDLVIQNKLCHNCLLASHDTSKCGKRSTCSVKGCGKKHTMYIHIDEKASHSESPHRPISNACFSPRKNTYMPVVSVLVNNSEWVYALLDTGSSNTFCMKALLTQLGIEGKTEEYQLGTLNLTGKKRSEIVSLYVSGQSGEMMDMTKVYVVEGIPVSGTRLEPPLPAHLSGLDLPYYTENRNVRVDLVIGQDNAEALIPLEVRKGSKREVFAVRTIFGWCINGTLPLGRVGNSVISNFVTTLPVEDAIARLWKLDNEDMEDLAWSQEDKSVIKLWDDECKKVDGHHEIPIPWIDRNESIPNNFGVARSRLESLVKKLDREDLRDKYKGEINKLLDNGYAEIVPDDEFYSADRVWYLPHHGVITEKKPDKLRLVFDCASKFQGKSLNDRCKQGPDLNNKLLFVLLRFRQHKFAVQADIEAMYNQVKIPEKDRDALRFLWYDQGKMVCYRMTSHLFGGIWCASSSTYALRRTVDESVNVSPLVKDTVERSFYVDDCLKSIANEQDCTEIIQETPKVLHEGGFNLTKFIVNDESLLQSIPEEHLAKEVMDIGPDSSGKVLGIRWNVLSDMFFFEVMVEDDEIITRRKILSKVSSMFDPLGLLSPLIVVGKLLFQEATRRKLSWDDPIPSDLSAQWKLWFQSLKDLPHLRIQRCIKPSEFDDAELELHHFSDASEKAYGCCSYLRCINKDGKIHTQLVMSKSKVAPLKQCTIPRLELQAAVMAAKIDNLLRKELDIKIDQSYFWVDSEIVLKYISNDTKRFHVFVGNRVGLIRQFSQPEQWNHISGTANPSDILTRGTTVKNLCNREWLLGPPMLRQYKSDWDINMRRPMVESLELAEDDKEVKQATPIFRVYNAQYNDIPADKENPLLRICKHYSSWYRMKRAVAWWRRLLAVLRKKHDGKGNLSPAEIKQGGVVLVKLAQIHSYSEEVDRLSRHQVVKRSSALKALNPYIDQDGVLRVGGRLSRAVIEDKHPCIIPRNHAIASAIILDTHSRAHLGVEWVHSIIRQDFWIVKARPLIKRIVKSCVRCRRLYAKPCMQQMADLPKERIEQGTSPFCYVGLDVFGPFYVKMNRSEVKRYGCVFTCLVTRAVHIEKLNTLETDSFLNGLRRFIARRGVPRKAYSDNATNLVGGNSELTRSIKQLSEKEIESYAVQKNIEWHFNVPTASHMGGAWERIIQGIRRVMRGVLNQNVRLTDEKLETVFCEVESILNGRPLTKLSDDPRDPSPLTPNHLLLAREGPKLPPGKFSAGDMYRKRWRHVQHLADQFWRQWIRLYLPELQKRHKWTVAYDNLAVGDLVLILDENTPRGLWPLALVKEVNKGRDGLVRSVRVKTRVTELVRPVTKIVLLEAANSRY